MIYEGIGELLEGNRDSCAIVRVPEFTECGDNGVRFHEAGSLACREGSRCESDGGFDGLPVLLDDVPDAIKDPVGIGGFQGIFGEEELEDVRHVRHLSARGDDEQRHKSGPGRVPLEVRKDCPGCVCPFRFVGFRAKVFSEWLQGEVPVFGRRPEDVRRRADRRSVTCGRDPVVIVDVGVAFPGFRVERVNTPGYG